MIIPRGVQILHIKGWRKPENTIYVRGNTRLANPFRHGPGVSREEAVIRYEEWMTRGFVPAETSHADDVRLRMEREYAWRIMERIKGINLACYCRLDVPCHRNLLLFWANPEIFEGYAFTHVYIKQAYAGTEA